MDGHDDPKQSHSFKAPVPRFQAPAPGEAAEAIKNTNGDASASTDALPSSHERRQAPPPPPTFAAPPLPAPRPGASAAKAAAIAAAKAAQHATPAQRERIVMEAAAAALAQQHEDVPEASATHRTNPQKQHRQQEPAAAPRPPPSAYQPPPWGQDPTNVPYVMEVMKNGAIIATLDLRALSQTASRGYITLGRAPDNDVLLDHPSSSRVHAIVQFNTEEGSAYLYDPGSTHGTFLNKKRVPAGQHIALRVGDQIRFGESTRIHVLGGPVDLMPEEGPSREQRRQAAAMEAFKKRKEKEAEVAKAQMAAAVAHGGGGNGSGEVVTWGMGGQDAEEDGEGSDGGEMAIDWRAHAATHGLTDKQQKIADKIRKRQLRAENLQKESDAIRVKERSMEELSAGQASTLARNEREIEKALEEMEELEENIVESIRDSVQGRRRAAQGGGAEAGGAGAGNKGSGALRKRRRTQGGDSDEEGDDEDDMFYDRTSEGKKGRKRRGVRGGNGKTAGEKNETIAEDAASLYGKLEALKEEMSRVEEQLRIEEVEAASRPTAEEKKSQAAKTSGAGETQGAGDGEGEGVDDDSLDAYMTGVASALETAKMTSLRKELAEIQTRAEETQRLLAVADPEQYYKKGSKAADAAVVRARRALELEKQRREAAEEQKRQAEMVKLNAAAPFVEEVEEEEENEGKAEGVEKAAVVLGVGGKAAAGAQKAAASAAPGGDNVHQLDASEEITGGLEVRQRPQPPLPTSAPSQATTTKSMPQSAPQLSAYQSRRQHIAAALEAQKPGNKPASSVPTAAAVKGDAVSSVLADLAILQQAKRGVEVAGDEAQDEEEPSAGAGAGGGAEEWRAPEGQTGDGRTKLNEALGY